jgi:2-isopropylmalate synthase
MPVPARHPYAGELVYTAFSGSHQDAINKGMKARAENLSPFWEVPYLPIDPSDVGRTFENVIRINSQSGKGGVAYIMEKEFGFSLPREMHPEFSTIIQTISEKSGKEVRPEVILRAFEEEYLAKTSPLAFKGCLINEEPASGRNGNFRGSEVKALIVMNGEEREIAGIGNGPIDAFCRALKSELGIDFTLTAYHEHALGQGSDSKAVAYIQIQEGGNRLFGAGVDTNISIASLRAVVSALNRSHLIARRLSAGSASSLEDIRSKGGSA